MCPRIIHKRILDKCCHSKGLFIDADSIETIVIDDPQHTGPPIACAAGLIVSKIEKAGIMSVGVYVCLIRGQQNLIGHRGFRHTVLCQRVGEEAVEIFPVWRKGHQRPDLLFCRGTCLRHRKRHNLPPFPVIDADPGPVKKREVFFIPRQTAGIRVIEHTGIIRQFVKGFFLESGQVDTGLQLPGIGRQDVSGLLFFCDQQNRFAVGAEIAFVSRWFIEYEGTFFHLLTTGRKGIEDQTGTNTVYDIERPCLWTPVEMIHLQVLVVIRPKKDISGSGLIRKIIKDPVTFHAGGIPFRFRFP